MLKLRSISKIDFDKFTQDHNFSSHFMQTSHWGEFEKVTNHTTPYYLGLVNENEEIVAATLLLEEHLPMNNCSLYAPSGFVIEYKNHRLLTIFTEKLKDFAKHKKAISIRINPAISNKNDKEANNIIQSLKKLGYKKQSKVKLLEYNYVIDLTKDLTEITNNYSDDIKEKIHSTEMYDIELSIGSSKDLEELFNLQENKNQKKYETLYDIFNNNEDSKIKLFLGKLHITKTMKTLEKDLRRINNQMSIIPIDNLEKTSKEKLNNLKKQREKISNDLEKFKKYKLEYGNYLTISANLMMEHNNIVWIISEASNEILKETNLSYRIYDEYIKYYKDQGFHLFKQLSPIENTPNINELKKDFGSEFIEYIGEYNLITNKPMYFIQNNIIPIFSSNKKDGENNGTSKTN